MLRHSSSLPRTTPPSPCPWPRCCAEHRYTTANLSFQNLKGRDRQVAQVLAACPLLDCHLALITRKVTGGTDSPVCDRYDRWGRSKRS